jgi:hypothetical protein
LAKHHAAQQEPPAAASVSAVEEKVMDFAEDLGRLLGTAQQKASAWLTQREAITRQLESIRDTATQLLRQFGAQQAAAAGAGRKRGRPAGSGRGPGRPPGSGVTKKAKGSRRRGRPAGRTMSAEAREKIRQAQLKRWARQKGEA